jgi:hypothetical protein
VGFIDLSMDFVSAIFIDAVIAADKGQWVRLLGGSSQKKQAAPNNPQQRLARFRQRYNQVLVCDSTWKVIELLS